MAKQEFKLEQTKGQFKVYGIVSGVNNSRNFKEGTTGSGKEYKTIKFNVKTSPTNSIRVELFGMEQDFIWPYSSKDKKSEKMPFKNRHKLPDGYHLIGVNVQLEEGDDGKLVKDSLHAFDAVEYIRDNLKDGDSVFVYGDIEHSEYEGQNGVQQQRRLTIRGIGKMDNEIDFEAEGFKEVSSFEQDIVVREVDVDKKEKIATVYAYIINYGDKFVGTTFTIDGNRNKQMYEAFPKYMKFGDLVSIKGLLINEALLEEVEEESDPFGSELPNGFNNKKITGYNSQVLITALDYDKWKEEGKGKYAENDFVVSDDVKNFGKDDSDDDSINPFSEESDEELPW